MAEWNQEQIDGFVKAIAESNRAELTKAVEQVRAEVRAETPSFWGPLIVGCYRSWTVRLAGFVVIAPEFLTEIVELLKVDLSPDFYRRCIQLIGIAFIIRRFYTNKSLIERGL